MLLQSVKMAFHSISANKMRSFLTMLGIIIGVMALVVLVSLVHGATGEIVDTIDELGSNLISVGIMDDHGKPVRYSQIDEIKSIDYVDLVAPMQAETFQVPTASGNRNVNFTGTTPSYKDIMDLKVEYGRFLMSPDMDNSLNVAVINGLLADKVFGRRDVVGEKIRAKGREFRIIGVLKDMSKGASAMFGESYDAYIPYTSFVRISEFTGNSINNLYISAENNEMSMAEESLKEFFDKRFDNDEDAYYMYNQSSIADAMSSVTGTLSLLLGGIAGISLLVGGIGIMNIMLVSVTERTREIGIRKAIGAGRGIIMFQFLIEALILSLTGCVIGILVSWLVIRAIDYIGNVNYGVSPGIVAVSVLFSVGIGLIFGIYPANKAARKNPIDALRAE